MVDWDSVFMDRACVEGFRGIPVMLWWMFSLSKLFAKIRRRESWNNHMIQPCSYLSRYAIHHTFASTSPLLLSMFRRLGYDQVLSLLDGVEAE
jgi:hypothetical protein